MHGFRSGLVCLAVAAAGCDGNTDPADAGTRRGLDASAIPAAAAVDAGVAATKPVLRAWHVLDGGDQPVPAGALIRPARLRLSVPDAPANALGARLKTGAGVHLPLEFTAAALDAGAVVDVLIPVDPYAGDAVLDWVVRPTVTTTERLLLRTALVLAEVPGAVKPAEPTAKATPKSKAKHAKKKSKTKKRKR
ncbi:MAG: hypothetical protein HY904_11770 [Deltaproteobacteria bacterium]|nr:hypothetical protein [Deltaproteobacteria bacterium]